MNDTCRCVLRHHLSLHNVTDGGRGSVLSNPQIWLDDVKTMFAYVVVNLDFICYREGPGLSILYDV